VSLHYRVASLCYLLNHTLESRYLFLPAWIVDVGSDPPAHRQHRQHQQQTHRGSIWS
ncbi:hypothetical protein D047_2672B, partial [Vibrio parahaemolyticus VPTS-2010_2]